MENLLAVVPGRTQASFYRTSAGAEVDLVLELPGGMVHVIWNPTASILMGDWCVSVSNETG